MLHTSDIHSRLLPYDLAPIKTDVDLGLTPEAPPYGGAARLAAMIRRERSKADRVLQVDSGDQWEGGPIFNADNGEPEVRWMSLMNYDAVVIGNHEFDKGVQNFTDKISRFCDYPLLAANYWWENTSLASSPGLGKLSSPYTVVNARGVRIGVVGMANLTTMYSLMDGGNSTQITPFETNEITRSYVDLLLPTVDVLMVVSHLGLSEDQDLITGYDAYYPYENAKPFFARADGDPTQWQQIDPSLSDCAAANIPRDQCTYLDGTVEVYIPGVAGIDVIEGGHLHIVLNPPQVIRDYLGRPVIISHSGAFSKYLGRLELELQFPPPPPQGVADDSDEMNAWRQRNLFGAEVVAHDYHAYPIDGIWCDDEAHSWRANVQGDQYRQMINGRPPLAADGVTDCRQMAWNAYPNDIAQKCLDEYDRDFRDFDCDRWLPDECVSRIERCTRQEDRPTTDLLQPYITQLDITFALPRIFAFAPRDIERRNSSTGGDSPLGNMTAESMRVRKRVEAELSLTNTLGIRDNLYLGPITLESMFNVFPFENTINIMYLSGAEMQELADYVGQRSAERGCQSQAQVAGMSFIMDCAQWSLNLNRYPCKTDDDCRNSDLNLPTPMHPDGWQCTQDQVCWAHTAYDVKINGVPLDVAASYKIAVNDYIAKGGSGFKVLKRNTTRIETGISLRDSLIDYMRGQCTCEEILGLDPANQNLPDDQKISSAGYVCARSYDGTQRIIDPVALAWCKQAVNFTNLYNEWRTDPTSVKLPGLSDGMCSCDDVMATNLTACPPATDDLWKELRDYCDLSIGKCTCADVVAGNESACGHITSDLREFCASPVQVPIAIAEGDGRIGRRVK